MMSSSSRWIFSTEELEQVLRASKEPQKEAGKRESLCSFIQRVCNRLRFRSNSILSAKMYFHRYYALRPLYPRGYMENFTHYTLAAIVIAAKMCSEHVGVKQIICEASPQYKQAKSVIERYTPPDKKMKLQITERNRQLDVELEQEYKCVCAAEMEMLVFFEFDVKLEYPDIDVVQMSKQLGTGSELSIRAWNFLQDAYSTNAILRYRRREIVASALAYSVSQKEGLVDKIGEKTLWKELKITKALADNVKKMVMDYDARVKSENEERERRKREELECKRPRLQEEVKPEPVQKPEEEKVEKVEKSAEVEKEDKDMEEKQEKSKEEDDVEEGEVRD